MTIIGQNGKPMRLVAVHQTTPLDDKDPKHVYVCDDPNDAIPIAEYIVGEMKKNPFTLEGKRIAKANQFDPAAEMAKWNTQPWHAKIGEPPDYYSMAVGQKAAAYQMWTERVAPNRPWDHKPIIAATLRQKGNFNKGWQKYAQYDYFYDIWSNIHYGYVGIAVGFSADELLGGAGLAQLVSDIAGGRSIQKHPENGTWPNSADDVQDHISIQLGIDLYASAKPEALTADIILRKISIVPLPWGSGGDNKAKRPHQCTS